MGNKPIIKQVPVDSLMRYIGWDPVGSGGGPEPSGPVQVWGAEGGRGEGRGEEELLGMAKRASSQKAGC